MLKKTILLIISIIFIFSQNINPVFAQQAPNANFDAVGNLVYFGQDADMGEYRLPTDIAITWINIILGFLGLIFLIMIIYSGFQWMTSGGNEETITKAKKRISSSVIGLAIVLFSYIIANWIMTTIQETPDDGWIMW